MTVENEDRTRTKDARRGELPAWAGMESLEQRLLLAGDIAVTVAALTTNDTTPALSGTVDDPAATISINGHEFRVWLAEETDQHLEGMMYVSEDEIADDQGMLFVFPDERLHAFWMKNTITPLDIAYARMNGTIVKTWTMTPLRLQSYPSIEPAMFALEVKAGTFEQLGIREGDRIAIPDEVFKASP